MCTVRDLGNQPSYLLELVRSSFAWGSGTLVRIVDSLTSSPNLPPSWRSLGMGRSCSSSGMALAGTRVCWEGLCSPEASLLRILLCATPVGGKVAAVSRV